MKLLEKRQKVIELIKEELNFSDAEDLPGAEWGEKISIEWEDFKYLGITKKFELEKILNGLHDDGYIYDYKFLDENAEKPGITEVFIDSEEWEKALGLNEKAKRSGIIFDKNTKTLHLGDKTCVIEGLNRSTVCDMVFNKPVGTRVKEDDIVVEIDPSRDTHARSVRDAVIAVNKKVKETFGIDKILICRRGFVWINT